MDAEPNGNVLRWRLSQVEEINREQDRRLDQHDAHLAALDKALAVLAAEIRLGTRIIGPVVTGITVGIVLSLLQWGASVLTHLATH
jgi:hypothetical protein